MYASEPIVRNKKMKVILMNIIRFIRRMKDEESLFSLVNQCGKESKQSLSQFFKQLLKPEQTKELSVQSTQLQTVFSNITTHFSISKSREISKQERNQRQLSKTQYNYGEIAFNTIFILIQKIKSIRNLSSNQIFYDLGSGSGKVLFAAGLCFPFQKCVGVEYLRLLFQASCKLREKVYEQQQIIEKKVNQILNMEEYKLPQIQLINNDFKNLDWEEGTIIFVSSTCYSSELMVEIQKQSQNLKIGTIMITLTRKLEAKENYWKVAQKVEGQTSWGTCNIFIQIKII